MATEGHKIFPHGAPVEIAPGLWQVEGSLPFPLKRNMTIYRLGGGELLLSSVIAMDEAGMAAVEKLGRPAVMLVPHPFHIMDAPFFKKRWPHLQVIAAADARERLAGKLAVDGTPDDLLPKHGVRFAYAPGMKYREVLLDLEVPGGRALSVVDLMVNTTGAPFSVRLLGPPGGGGVGVARIVRFRQIAEKPAARSYIERLAGRGDLKHLLFGHGPAVSTNVPQVLHRATGTL